ncbi:MAG: hypothetical protein QM535_10020 [Limnohabitans sp.]|nr:hypothetical protein [Limnohabitans sp.]
MYKNWSLRFLIYKIIIEVYLGIIYFNQPVVFNIGIEKIEEPQNLSILIFKLLSILFSILGIVFLTLSVIKKEEKDWKFYTSLIGQSVLIIFSIVMYAIS